jgi:hypothetical protein
MRDVIRFYLGAVGIEGKLGAELREVRKAVAHRPPKRRYRACRGARWHGEARRDGGPVVPRLVVA